jgi:cell division protein FtsQ
VSPDETAGSPVEELEAEAAVVLEAVESDAPAAAGPSRPETSSVLRIDEARRRRLRPWAILGVAVVVLVTGSVALSYTSILGARVIEVEGETRLGARRVMRLAGVEAGTNVFHLDVAAAEARLRAEPWILDASVDTSLPGTITITVRERRPVMVVGSAGDRRLVAEDGTVLGRAARTIDLPQVVPAPGASLDQARISIAGSVVEAMAPALRARVDSVTVSPDDQVTLVVDDDVAVRYGGLVEATAKAQALRAILDYAEERGESLLSVDVSSASAPTARFVGSQPIAIGPDPSADQGSTPRTARDAQEPDEKQSPSPSP